MKLHHVGFVVSDIQQYEKNLIFERKISHITDIIQNSELALYSCYGSCYIELIQPCSEKSFSFNALQKNGNHFNHFCYELLKDDLNKVVNDHKLILVKEPVPAILFAGREVTFYYSRNKQIVEFLLQ